MPSEPNTKRTHWIVLLPFFLLCGFTMLTSFESIAHSQLGIDSIAPENLRTLPESFRLSLAVERGAKDIQDMTASESWREMQNTLDGYADRLALYDAQQTRRSFILMALYLASTVLLFYKLDLRPKPPQASLQTRPSTMAPPGI